MLQFELSLLESLPCRCYNLSSLTELPDNLVPAGRSHLQLFNCLQYAKMETKSFLHTVSNRKLDCGEVLGGMHVLHTQGHSFVNVLI